jgi:phosphatidylglycerol:prolipoprotein diacylglycerol transferase
MHPICFKAGPITIHWYGVMMALGFLAGLANWIALGRKQGRDSRFCSDLLFWLMVSGIVGARMAYVIANLDMFVEDPVSIFRVDQGGLIYYGGFLAAAGALLVFARSRGQTVRSLLDFGITSLPLGHAFGRIGCVINGCCFGTVFRGWPSITFPAHSLPWWQQVDARLIPATSSRSLPVHPVQVYEAIYNLVLYMVLVRLYRRPHREGMVAVVYFWLYPLGRFMFEFLRVPDHDYRAGLSGAQWLSIMIFAVGSYLFFRPGQAGKT